MHDEVIFDRLQIIIEHATVIDRRLNILNEAAHPINPFDPTLLFDSLITRLQALTENIKKIEKQNPQFFESELPVDVVPIIRFRDLAAHHYEKLEEEIILQICKRDVPALAGAIQVYLAERGGR